MRRVSIRSLGFTLVETLIVVALSTAMMLAISFLMYTFNETTIYQQALVESSGSASIVMRELESLVLPADAVLQAHTFAGATYTSSSTALVLEIPSIDNAGNVITNTHDYAVLYVVGTDMFRILETNALSTRVSGTKQLSATVQALTFTYTDSDFTKVNAVTVDVQTEARAKQNILSDRRREQLRLRNY